MNPQHTEDYKQTAVKYYLEHNEDMRDTCEIFNCKFQSLARWVEKYKQNGNINRKTRKNHNLKITPEIEKFVKEYVRKYSTTTFCLIFLFGRCNINLINIFHISS